MRGIGLFNFSRGISQPRFSSLPVVANEEGNLEINGANNNENLADSKNKEKIQEYDREYYLKNKQKISERKKEYYLQNKEKMSERQKQYYLQNKEKQSDKQKEYKSKNKEKLSEKQKAYWLNNKEKLSKRQRDYWVKNKEKISEMQKKYYSQNKEKMNEKQKEYWLKNKEKMQEYDREYRLKNKDKLSERHRKNRLRKNQEKNKNYVPPYSYKDIMSTKRYFDSAAKSLHISELSDWYRISVKQIRQTGGSGIFHAFGSLGNALEYAYPEYDWDLSKFSFRGKKSAQRWLCIKIKELLPNTTIIEEYYHPDLVWDKSEKKSHLQFDIWIPEYNLALEYQGEHHYFDLPRAYGPGNTSKIFYERDQEKKEKCIQKGIPLICIPYWWDGDVDSLSSTLNQILPDVFPKTDAPPIPTNPPSFVEKKSKNQLFNPHILMQGLDWINEDPKGWIMSEKLDGVRAYWDGAQFWSKRGKIINVPESFKEGLPPFHLDGELWGGYMNADRANAYIKSICGENKRRLSVIHNFKFCVFDAPHQEGNYQKRHLFLQNYFQQEILQENEDKSKVFLIPIQICLGLDHLNIHLQEIVQKGGEGIMIYHPEIPYEKGRTRNLLKVKNYLESEVKFLKLNTYSYSFFCEQQNGKTCLVKCSASDYLNPPPFGTILITRHLGFFPKSGKLKYPSLLRVANNPAFDIDLSLAANKE